ncbi:hypothetical protein [Cellulosimicrobium funkei]|uniref:hypothetical protein n=1 Tax=Cellulosimicrobium funkei TaxID=264251 RepID=UPI0036BA221E
MSNGNEEAPAAEGFEPGQGRQSDDKGRWRSTNRALLISAAVLLVVVVVVVVVVQVRAQQERDTRSDVYYCVQPGIGAFDRAPATGRLCADLLANE